MEFLIFACLVESWPALGQPFQPAVLILSPETETNSDYPAAQALLHIPQRYVQPRPTARVACLAEYHSCHYLPGIPPPVLKWQKTARHLPIALRNISYLMVTKG